MKGDNAILANVAHSGIPTCFCVSGGPFRSDTSKHRLLHASNEIR